MLKSGRICDIICLSVFSVREEVEAVIYIINLVFSVVGSVVGNLITKWFGRKNSTDKPEEKPPKVAAFGGFVCVSL